MEYHLERKLRLRTEFRERRLYDWAISEVDEQGEVVGGDQIPWPWTLTFSGTSITLHDAITIRATEFRGEPIDPPEVSKSAKIRIELQLGGSSDFSEPTLAMFGTDRVIDSFTLVIYPASEGERESCTAWGIPSYTSEVNFRYETSDDSIEFYMTVSEVTFAAYASRILEGSVDRMIFQVSRADGLYSTWSPSITADCVKVLTHEKEQKVDLPPGFELDLPRLGKVGEADLQFLRTLPPGPKIAQEITNSSAQGAPVPPVTLIREISSVDPHQQRVLTSLRQGVWFVGWLLLLIFFALLLR